LQSVSRVMPDIVAVDHRARAMEFNEILSSYNEAEDLINIGAYVKGSNPQIDHALNKIQSLRSFLKQDLNDGVNYKDTLNQLNNLIEKPLV